MLGTMLTKEILPLYDKELDYLLCDLKYDAEEFMVNGQMGIVKDDDDEDGVQVAEFARQGRPVVEIRTVIFAEVLGRTLSGRPLLSCRRYFRRIAWHRVRQMKQLNEPIEVKITEWNTGGLLTRIEGLRALIPKQKLVKKVNMIFLDEAYEFIKKMPLEPDAGIWGALLGACAVHRDIKLGQKVADLRS